MEEREKDTRTHHCCSYKKVTEKKQLDQETHTTREEMLHWDEMLTVMVYPNDNGQSGCRKD